MWLLDSSYMKQIVGPEGTETIKAAWCKAVLPAEDMGMEVAASCEQSQHFLSSGLFQWSASSCQGEIKGCS